MQVDLMPALHDRPLVLTRAKGLETLCREASKGVGNVSVAETETLPSSQFLFGQFCRRRTAFGNLPLQARQALKAVEEPAGDASDFVNVVNGPATAEGLEKCTHAPVGRHRE